MPFENNEENWRHRCDHGFHGNGLHGGKAREGINNKIIKLMNLKSNDIVADFGSGDGFYSAQFAKICEKVFAIDMNAANFKNKFYDDNKIVKLNADICKNLEIPEITHAFFSNSFHDLECQEHILDRVALSLVKQSRITMIEFKLDTSYGPPRNIRFEEKDLVKKIETHGFRKIDGIDLGGHYAVSFVKV
ncbi:MAG: rRNA adenine N-6-methyltransferase family protein [Candidatus Lokiarchaeota archaeon]